MPLSRSDSPVIGAWRDGLLLIAWCAVIFLLSAQPSVPMPHLFPHVDKLVHGAGYAVMGWLAWAAFRHAGRGSAATLLLAAGFCSLYGVSDEWHQSFVPGRMVEVGDWLADTLGGIVGAYITARFFPKGIQLKAGKRSLR